MKQYLCIFLLFSLQVSADEGHLRLKDSLDREDGYCLDLVGSGNYVRFDMPLTAHNCKPGLYADEAVTFENKQIYFPTYGACATAAGLNGRALPGAAIIPRVCDEESAFLIARPLQQFIMHQDGKIELEDQNLCLTVSEKSDSTFDQSHRYRTLFLIECDRADPSRSQWHFVVPKTK